MRVVRLCSPILVLLSGGLLSADKSVIVSQVQVAALGGDFDSARRELKEFRNSSGATPEYIEALSWLGRGQLGAKNYRAAVENAAEVRKLCLDQLTHRRLDAEPRLPTALGASIEVRALAAALEGRRDEAVVFLRGELRRWH